MATARILTSYYRPKPGGCCKRLFMAINALLDAGHEVHYLSVTPFPVGHKNCYFHRFFWPEKCTENYLFWAVFHFLAPVQMLCLGYRYQITHCFAFNSSYALLLKLLCNIKHIPLVLFIRGDVLESHRLNGKGRWLVKLEGWLEGLVINNIRIIGNSSYLTEKIIKRHSYFKPRNYDVIRNHINKLPDQLIKKRHTDLHIACVGTLDKNKNQEFIFYLMNKLSQVNVQLFIYGTGRDEMKLKSLAKELGISRQVKFMGWVDNESIWGNVDILLAPSLNEGSPNAVLEALESGTPVIASDIPQHNEVLPISCLLTLDNTDIWIDIIKQIASDKTRLSEIYNIEAEFAKPLLFNWDNRIVSVITASGS